MLTTLHEVLTAVAYSKGIEESVPWVNGILNHCQACQYPDGSLELISSPGIPFGTLDGDFICQDFVLYLELETEEGNQFRLETCSSLELLGNSTALTELLSTVYAFRPEQVLDFKVLYELEDIHFHLLDQQGELLRPGQEVNIFAALPDHDLYILQDGDSDPIYYHNKADLKRGILALANQDPLPEDFSTARVGRIAYLIHPDLHVRHGAEELDFCLHREKGKPFDLFFAS